MNLPETKTITLNGCYNGEEMVQYLSEKLSIEDSEVWKVMYESFFSDTGVEEVIMNMIVESESFCNDNDMQSKIFRTIHEDFGEDILVSFMSRYVIEFEGGSVE